MALEEGQEPVAAKGPRVKGSTSLEMAKAIVKIWLDEDKKVKVQPHKFPDYVFDGETLYRHIPHRAGNEDVATWKLCVLQELRETVLHENHDSPAAGHVGSRKTIARHLE